MRHRSPARFLAPLALLATAAVVYLVVVSSGVVDTGSSSASSSTPSRSTPAPGAKAETRRRAKVYVVKQGDVLGKIAEKTGVALEDIIDLNPSVDANSLRTGQRLKLEK